MHGLSQLTFVGREGGVGVGGGIQGFGKEEVGTITLYLKPCQTL
jgi:hypothetical protein